MIETNPEVIAKAVIKLSGLNVFKNSRQRKYVEMRALLSYMLREDLYMGWSRISQFYQDNGKSMNHATVIHAVKNYPVYRKHNKQLQKLEGCFNFSQEISEENINTTLNLQNNYEKLQYEHVKLQKDLESPLISLMYGIPENKWSEVIERIGMLKKSWEWKSNDKCLVVQSTY
mgnify:CR=1 FL=1